MSILTFAASLDGYLGAAQGIKYVFVGYNNIFSADALTDKLKQIGIEVWRDPYERIGDKSAAVGVPIESLEIQLG